ncbi:MAG: zinc-ribbon domain-containing protein [Candidatus Binatia bacterium]
MHCLQCGHENPDGAKFCGECGAKLELLCPSCGKGNPPVNKFCYECGHRHAEPAAPARSPVPRSASRSTLARERCSLS